MAALKRKKEDIAGQKNGHLQKRIKTEDDEKKKPRTSETVQTFETETDSEPIMESDTTSQSGDDDGASWPSDEVDEDLEGVQDSGVLPDVHIAGEASGGTLPIAKTKSDDSAPTGTRIQLTY